MGQGNHRRKDSGRVSDSSETKIFAQQSTDREKLIATSTPPKNVSVKEILRKQSSGRELPSYMGQR